ncbi:hypothetical protein NXS19_011537 [Fusarium pseudograminearum]|nr:hypothetical protein NXS19_011537 [Fusarium pseudograminearum]
MRSLPMAEARLKAMTSFSCDKPPYATRTGGSKHFASPFISSTALSKCDRASGRGIQEEAPPTTQCCSDFNCQRPSTAGSPASLHAPRGNIHIHSRHTVAIVLCLLFRSFILFIRSTLSFFVVRSIVLTNIHPNNTPAPRNVDSFTRSLITLSLAQTFPFSIANFTSSQKIDLVNKKLISNSHSILLEYQHHSFESDTTRHPKSNDPAGSSS